MSTNHIFDAIEDEVIKSLEVTETFNWLPQTFTITLPVDQFQEFVKLGLNVNGKVLPPTTNRVSMLVDGHQVWVLPENNDPEVLTLH